MDQHRHEKNKKNKGVLSGRLLYYSKKMDRKHQNQCLEHINWEVFIHIIIVSFMSVLFRISGSVFIKTSKVKGQSVCVSGNKGRAITQHHVTRETYGIETGEEVVDRL